MYTQGHRVHHAYRTDTFAFGGRVRQVKGPGARGWPSRCLTSTLSSSPVVSDDAAMQPPAFFFNHIPHCLPAYLPACRVYTTPRMPTSPHFMSSTCPVSQVVACRWTPFARRTSPAPALLPQLPVMCRMVYAPSYVPVLLVRSEEGCTRSVRSNTPALGKANPGTRTHTGG